MTRRDRNLPPPPTPDEERAWFAEMRDPATPEDRRKALRDRLIAGNLGLVWRVVLTSKEPDRYHEDMASHLTLYLIRCVDLFDPSRGFRFNTYAMDSLLLRARNYGRKYENVVHVPAWIIAPNAERRARLDGDLKEHRDAAKAAPKALLLSHPDMPELMAHAGHEKPAPHHMGNDLVRRVADEVSLLRPDRREVFMAYYGIGQERETSAQIAARLGKTVKNVNSIQYHGVMRIRKRLGVEGVPPTSQP